MAKQAMKGGPSVPAWLAAVVVVAILAVIVGFYMYSSTPHGEPPARPGGPPAGMMSGPGGPAAGARPGGPPPGMMGGPGTMPGGQGRPSAPPGLAPGG
ncbi:MAG: hypothetical protein IT208_14560 [Chthonomonadales bacterium]|nr:hypothetical protein [Chthonomonadales bacterium]